jgi:hypothetical protein
MLENDHYNVRVVMGNVTGAGQEKLHENWTSIGRGARLAVGFELRPG